MLDVPLPGEVFKEYTPLKFHLSDYQLVYDNWDLNANFQVGIQVVDKFLGTIEIPKFRELSIQTSKSGNRMHQFVNPQKSVRKIKDFGMKKNSIV